MANPTYAAAWRNSIDPIKPTPSQRPRPPRRLHARRPPQSHPHHESTQTTHFSIVDADGNAVSSTYTLNGGFGSGVTVEGLGFLLNNEMDDFTSKIGVPNIFGLIQGSANSIAPGKRPLSAMTPTIVTTPSHWYKPGKLASSSAPPAAPPSSPPSPTTSSASSTTTSTSSRPPTPRASTTNTCPTASTSKRTSPSDVADQLKAMGYTTNRTAVADEHNPGVWGDSELIAHRPQNRRTPRRPRPPPHLRQSRRLLTHDDPTKTFTSAKREQ